MLDLVDKFQVGVSSISGKSIDRSMALVSDTETTTRSHATTATNNFGEKTLEATPAGTLENSPMSNSRDRSSPLRDALYKLGGTTPNTTINTPMTPAIKQRVQGHEEAEEDEDEEFEDTQAEFDFSHVQFSSPTHNETDKDEETEGEGFYFSAQEG